MTVNEGGAVAFCGKRELAGDGEIPAKHQASRNGFHGFGTGFHGRFAAVFF